MSIFDSLGQKQPMNPLQIKQQLMSDPAGTLKQAGFNVPQGMNNPQQIIQHLLQTGQLQNARYQQALRMMSHR